MKMELMFSSRIFRSSYREAIAYALENGYGGIEWYLNDFRLPLNPGKLEAFFTALDEAGLYASFHLPTTDVELGHRKPRIARASLEYLKMYVELLSPWLSSRRYRPPLTLHVGANSIPMEELHWERTVANLAELADTAGAAGGVLCLENLKWGWASDPERFSELVDRSGVMVTFDAGHARSSPPVREGRVSLREWVETLAPRIVHVHLYAYEDWDTGVHVPPRSWDEVAEAYMALRPLKARGWVLELPDLEGLERARSVLESGTGRGKR